MTTALPSPEVERYLFGFLSIGCLLAGYCVGSSNVTVSQQCAGRFSEDADPDTSSKLVAAFSVGALAGCLLLMRLGDGIGRWRFIHASAHAFLAGSLLTAGCPCPGQRGFGTPATVAVLALARFLWGLGSALNFQATSQYVAEVMSQERRGFYLPLLSLVVVVGDLCGACVGAMLEKLAFGWRLTAAAMAPPALALAQAATVFPDSPRWLALVAVVHARDEKKRKRDGFREARRRGDRRPVGPTPGPTLSLSDLSGDERNAPPGASDAEGADAARRALTVLHCTRPSRRGLLGIFRRGFPEVVAGAKQRAALDRELRAIFASAARGDESSPLETERTKRNTYADASSVAASRALFVALTLTVLGQLSAGPVIQYFPKHIFELAGHVASDDGGAARARARGHRCVAHGVDERFQSRRHRDGGGFRGPIRAALLLRVRRDRAARRMRRARVGVRRPRLGRGRAGRASAAPARAAGGRVRVSVPGRVPSRVRFAHVTHHRRYLAHARAHEHHGHLGVPELGT